MIRKPQKKSRNFSTLYEIRITLILNHDMDIVRKDNYRTIQFMNIDTKMLTTMFSNQTQQYIKRTIFTTKED